MDEFQQLEADRQLSINFLGEERINENTVKKKTGGRFSDGPDLHSCNTGGNRRAGNENLPYRN